MTIKIKYNNENVVATKWLPSHRRLYLLKLKKKLRSTWRLNGDHINSVAKENFL